jgi:hypothetical protein
VTESGFRYAGWFMLDVRLTASLLTFSVALAVLVLAMWFKGRRWDEYVVGFCAVFVLSLFATLLLTNAIAAFPALSVETMFPVP